MERDYTVHHARDMVVPETADAVVAAIGDDLGAILIANDHHYRGTASPMTQSKLSLTKLRRLHRISMRGKEHRMAHRIEELLLDIEYEFARYQQRPDKRMYLEIGDSYWRSHR